MKYAKKILVLVALINLCFSFYAEGRILEFKFKKGDTSRILSTVVEEVYLNGIYQYTSTILNRISSEVTEVSKDGSGTCEANFMTSESSSNQYNGRNFSWGQEYQSTFKRDKTGKYTISDIYFMPTVRDVPVFPKEPIKIGDTWTCEGHEAHDMRTAFGIEKPFEVPFTATYKYLKDEKTAEGKTLNVIQVYYNLDFKSPAPSSYSDFQSMNSSFIPAYTSGFSNQTIWWDNERGTIDRYSEKFKIGIKTYSGDQIIFQGNASAEVTDFSRANTQENVKKITDTINNLGIKDIDVKEDKKGLTISIENIQFMPDSSTLMESEKIKLQKIAEILKEFDNDLLITGHCANRGSAENQKTISEQRAVSVAEYLTYLKVRDAKCIFTQGKGASEPVASNATELGRTRNRRVEITIMDK